MLGSHFPYFFHVFSLSIIYNWLILDFLTAFFPAVLCPYKKKYEECRKERTQYKSRVNVTLLFDLKTLEEMPNVDGVEYVERGLWNSLKQL